MRPRRATADWGYRRLRRVEYPERDVQEWADWAREPPWSEAFVFFEHEDAATGPRLARQFMQACAVEA